MRGRALLLASAAAVLAAVPAAGDWLITRDGTRIETEGPWEEKGSQVIFTLPGGRLSALRLADVDLEASATATRAAATGAAAAAAETASAETRARPSVKKFTNETVSVASGGPEDGAEEETDFEETDFEEGSDAAQDAAAADGPAPSAGEPVEVVSWSSRDSADGLGLEIVGTLRNTGGEFAAGIRVRARIPGQEGEPPLDAEAFLHASALAPGTATGFVVRLPETLFLPGEPTFEVSSEAFRIGGRAEPEASADEVDAAAGELEPPP